MWKWCPRMKKISLHSSWFRYLIVSFQNLAFGKKHFKIYFEIFPWTLNRFLLSAISPLERYDCNILDSWQLLWLIYRNMFIFLGPILVFSISYHSLLVSRAAKTCYYKCGSLRQLLFLSQSGETLNATKLDTLFFYFCKHKGRNLPTFSSIW